MDVIILSGGLGTRLREVINDRPKTMALINEKPFLEHTLKYIEQYDVQNVILAVGYKKEQIEQYFGNKYNKMNIYYSEEDKPLGTGGAIKKALNYTNKKDVIVMNGDIYAKVNLKELMEEHIKTKSKVTIALKEMKNFDRFGIVEFEHNNIITKFKEKEYTEKGYINVGIYAMSTNIFENLELGEKFSIENDFFSKYTDSIKHTAYFYDGEFIDIGLPKDYAIFKKSQERV